MIMHADSPRRFAANPDSSQEQSGTYLTPSELEPERGGKVLHLVPPTPDDEAAVIADNAAEGGSSDG